MKQQFINTWEHSPSTIQASKVPVEEVPKSLNQISTPQLTASDLMGLSWVLFTEDEI